MIGKTLDAFFNGMQDIFNPFQIYFDTIYNYAIDDYNLAMQSYNLRQMINFDVLHSASITQELLESLRANRPGGGSYNVLQYKHSPLKKTDLHPNNSIYFISYENNEVKVSSDINNRKYVPLDQETKEALKASFISEQKEYSDNPIQHTIHNTQAGDVIPKLETKPAQLLSRLGFYGDLEVECRFITCNTSLFEDFLILYNSLLHKRNPPFAIEFKDFGEAKLPITTRFGEITQAEHPDHTKYGNLSFIGFNVTLTTMFLSSYVKTSAPVNRVEAYTEIVNNKYPFKS